MSQTWNKKEYQLLSKQVHRWGFLLRKKRSSHRSVCICLGFCSEVGHYLRFFVLFPSDLFGVDAGMIFCFAVRKLASSQNHLFWFARHPRALNHALWYKFLRRPCCPANFFLRSSRGMPTAPAEDAPACVQRLNARALRCLQRFHEKHSQHMLSSEARMNAISLRIHPLNCTPHCFVSWSQVRMVYNTKVLQHYVQEGASAQMLQVEQKSSPSTAEFALEGQDTHGQDCSPEVCRCTLLWTCWNDDILLKWYEMITYIFLELTNIYLYRYLFYARLGVILCNTALLYI